MRGRFRRDLELAPGGEFRLRRRRGPRLLSAALAFAGVLATAVDVFAFRPWLAAAQLVLSLAFVLLLLLAELDSWSFEGEQAVRRMFDLRALGFREYRVAAKQIRRVSVAAEDGRARAWIETRGGDEYALVEGDEREVLRIVERLQASVRLAAIDPGSARPH
jgi:hypothetical protein